MNILAFVDAWFNHGFSMIAIFIQRRVSFIPNLLNYQYFDYFSSHELLYWRTSILRWFGFENPYNIRIPALIGEVYYNKEMGANTGMFGEGFSHFGWFALFIYPLLYIFVFRLFDACVKEVDKQVLFTAIVLLALSFLDGSFWGVMLTEGFLFVCLFFYYIPRQKMI